MDKLEKEAMRESLTKDVDKKCDDDQTLSGSPGSSADQLNEDHHHGNWGSQVDFLLSCVGYAVGLGNLWRFPYLCMRNGGGAFLIPYFTFLTLCGIPLYFLELSLGQFSSLSPLSMWRLSPMFKGLGYGMIIVSGIVCVYYNVIMAWSLYYMFSSFTTGELPWSSCGNWWNTPGCIRRGGLNLNATDFSSNATYATYANVTGSIWDAMNDTAYDLAGSLNTTTVRTDKHVLVTEGNITTRWTITTPAEEFWHHKVLQKTSGIDNLGSIHWPLLGCLLLAWVIVYACLFKGVQSSGKVVYVTATMPYFMLVVLLVRGATLPGALQGVMYYLTPDFKRLASFQVWLEACAQIFYSLGPAYGGLITMASYNKFKNNCYRDALLIPAINCLTSLFAGFVIFCVIGYLAHTTGLPVDTVITSGPGLAFVVYPEALSTLPASPVWSIIFFFMLVIIGLDTQFGMFETMVSGFVDEFPHVLQRKKTLFTAMMCCLQFLLGIPIVTQGGIYIFQIFDWYAATFSLITISTIECLVVAWIYGAGRLYEDIKMMIGFKPNNVWRLCWMLVTPLTLLVVLVSTMIKFVPPKYGDYTYPWWAIGFGWVLALCSLIPIPLCAAEALYSKEGSFIKRLKEAIRPASNWGPRLEEDRIGSKYANQTIDLQAAEEKCSLSAAERV